MMAPAFITRTAGPRGRIKALDHHHGADLTLSIDNFNEQELSPCPRMCRAGVLLRLWLPLVAWTIPACAGPTSLASYRAATAADYPRVRGADLHIGKRSAGSPWTIPACAGPTRSSKLSGTTSWDYPRVRGADGGFAADDGVVAGLSPRARGRHAPHRTRPLRAWTIPACAGPTERQDLIIRELTDYPRVRGADTC